RSPTTRSRCSAGTATSATTWSSCSCATRAASARSTASPSSEEGARAMIDFELSENVQGMQTMTHMLAEQAMRPISREYDEREHEKPWDFLNMMWGVSRGATMTGGAGEGEKKERRGPSEQNLNMCVTVEELCWGDVGLYLSIPNSGLGGAAVAAAGTPEQKERFLARFRDGEPKWGAMAITAPQCGSDSSASQTTAVKDGDHWGLNGRKIF